jgi:Protein of unknown function (DUF2752)
MQKFYNYFWLGLLLLFPIVLWVLPADFFDNGPPLCPSMLLLGVECPGCGLTRGVMHLMHFDFENALFYNTLSFLALPVLFGIWARWVWFAWRAVRAENLDSPV